MLATSLPIRSHTLPAHSSTYSVDSNTPSTYSARSSSSYASTSSLPSSVSTSVDSSESFPFSALCMFDFHSDDPDHLTFNKNEILDVVRKESSGWWAAMHRGGETIGWIPAAFVTPLPDAMAESLRNVREELRVYEYEAEQLYTSAPTSRLTFFDEPEAHGLFRSSIDRGRDIWQSAIQPASPQKPQPPRLSLQRTWSDGKPLLPPPSPTTPMPEPPDLAKTRPFSRICSEQMDPNKSYFSLPDPSPISSPISRPATPDILLNELPASIARKRAADKVAWKLGKEAVTFHEAQNRPRFLLPVYQDQLQLDAEGQVKSGTLQALFERLTTEPRIQTTASLAYENSFRRTFLATFRTFTSSDVLFENLVKAYRSTGPANISDSDREEWKEKVGVPAQRLVLTVITTWIEEFKLLDEEPHIAPRLKFFLSAIRSSQHVTAVDQIVSSMEKRTFIPLTPSTSIVRKRKKSRAHKNDISRLDATDLAEQLTLIESNHYRQITRRECLAYAKVQSGQAVERLTTFCSTHDRLVAWVQSSILDCESVGKRTDVADLWIKVAEKCRGLCNYASMSAIVVALKSTVITRLHLTWSYVSRKSALETLAKFNEPIGGFPEYRKAQAQADGPCVPFVGMYLSDIVHIRDGYPDAGPQINFKQRTRLFEVVTTMLKHQVHEYALPESEATRVFATSRLWSNSGGHELDAKFWARSKELQHLELTHAEIRRNLELAGF